jgi:hypothetical protein
MHASVVHVHMCFTWSRACGHRVAGHIMDEFGVVCQLATPDPICINYVGQKKNKHVSVPYRPYRDHAACVAGLLIRLVCMQHQFHLLLPSYSRSRTLHN